MLSESPSVGFLCSGLRSIDAVRGDSIDPQTERGLHWFVGLPDDSYTVGEELKAGWMQTDPAPVPVGIIQPGYDLFMTDPATT